MDCDMEIDDLATDGDSEYEEEEYLLYLDIEPTALGESQIRNAQSLKIFGLDTKKPLLQINNQFFQGKITYSYTNFKLLSICFPQENTVTQWERICF